jgi:Na+-driven multidrug efflux pump
MSTSIANFPFNALLLLFGTEVNAAYHIGRRLYQQLTGPFYRAFSTVTSIVVGQTLGDGDVDGARDAAHGILALSLGTLVTAGVVLFVAAEPLVGLFTRDGTTIGYAVAFTRVFAVSTVSFGVFFPLAGALRGAGDTRTPFYARLLGSALFLLGASYLLGVTLGYGLPGVHAGLALSYVCWAAVVVVGFRRGGWAETATAMIAERSERDEPTRR